MSDYKAVDKVVCFLKENPGYLKKGAGYLAFRLNVDISTINKAKKIVNGYGRPTVVNTLSGTVSQSPSNVFTTSDINTLDSLTEETLIKLLNKVRKNKQPIEQEETYIKPFTNGDPNNVLIIGDLHAPFILDGYLEFCREQQEKYNCGTVVAIGDIVDAHSWSFHTHDVDGMSVGEELEAAKKQLNKVFKMFPVAKCLMGNHDLLVSRKAKEYGLSTQFIRPFSEIVGAPNTWEFAHEFNINNVKYIHGSIGNAIKRAKEVRMSICQGHLHSESFVDWSVSEKDAIFGLQVGCGLDHSKYAFEYAKPFPKKPVISCGIILEKGTFPIIKLMNL